MRRGATWWADLEPPVGRRPVVLVSRTNAYAYRKYIIVVPVSTRVRGIRAEVLLDIADSLP